MLIEAVSFGDMALFTDKYCCSCFSVLLKSLASMLKRIAVALICEAILLKIPEKFQHHSEGRRPCTQVLVDTFQNFDCHSTLRGSDNFLLDLLYFAYKIV